MHTTDLIHRPTVNWPTRPACEPSKRAPSYHELVSPVRNAILRLRRQLEFVQRPDGSWLAAPHGNSSLSSQLILLLTLPDDDVSELTEQAAAALRADQREDGAWPRDIDAPVDVSASVAAYFALKLMGDEPNAPHMRVARHAIRTLGGADAVDNTTRLWLALFGQINFDCCEPIAPEWLLLPNGWRDSIFGKLSADEWRTRTAQSIVWALRPVRRLELEQGIRELYVQPPDTWPAPMERRSRKQRGWDWLSYACERAGCVPFRKRSLEIAKARVKHSAAACAELELSFEEIVWHMIALRAVGQPSESAEWVACEARLNSLLVEDAELAIRPASTTDSVADTERALRALAAGGVDRTRPLVANGAAWLVEQWCGCEAAQGVAEVGRFARRLAATTELLHSPESDGTLPPDMQMTRDRMARLLARHRDREFPRDRVDSLAAEASDALVLRLPFASSARAIGPAIEVLAERGLPTTHRSIGYGVATLRTLQRADGSWGDGENRSSIASTAAAIRGLVAAGENAESDAVAAAVNWLLVAQDRTGQWGDVATTAAVILGLVAAGHADHDATRRGIDAILEACQIDDDERQVDVNTVSAALFTLSRWLAAVAAIYAEPMPTRLRLVGELSLEN